MNCMATRGFPTTGDSAFPGEHNINNQLTTFIDEGGKAYCCRFGLSLHGLDRQPLRGSRDQRLRRPGRRLLERFA